MAISKVNPKFGRGGRRARRRRARARHAETMRTRRSDRTYDIRNVEVCLGGMRIYPITFEDILAQ